MEVSLPHDQESRLTQLAQSTGRGTDELVQEAIGRMLDHSDWFKAQVQVGIDQIDRGEFIEDEEMDVRISRMLHT